MGKLEREIETLNSRIDFLASRVAKLEAEEAREAKQGTIRPGTRRGPKPKTDDAESTKETE